MEEAWRYLWALIEAADVVRREEGAAPTRAATGIEDLERLAELEKHVLMALALPLGLASQPLAGPDAHVRADESILKGYGSVSGSNWRNCQPRLDYPMPQEVKRFENSQGYQLGLRF